MSTSREIEEQKPEAGNLLSLKRLISSLHYGNYRRYLAGCLLTHMTSQMDIVILGWQVLQLTDSALWVALVAFARGISLLILSPLTGVMADRQERQRQVVMAHLLEMVSLVALAILTWQGRVQPWHVVLASFAIGSGFAIYAPARAALLPNLVPPSALQNAATFEYSSTRVMGFLGPVMAGLLVERLGIWQALIFEAPLLIVASLLFLSTRENRPSATVAPRARAGLRDSLVESLTYLRGEPRLLPIVLLGLVLVPVGMTYQKLLPVVARDVLAAGAEALGWMTGLTSLGTALAGFALASSSDRFNRGRVIWQSAVLFAAIMVLFALTRQLWLALLMLFLLGVISGIFLTLSNVLLQSLAPDAVRGRVMAMWGMVWGLIPVATLLAGAAAERWGVTTTITATGLLCLGYLMTKNGRAVAASG